MSKGTIGGIKRSIRRGVTWCICIMAKAVGVTEKELAAMKSGQLLADELPLLNN
jgi:hypothetical protein